MIAFSFVTKTVLQQVFQLSATATLVETNILVDDRVICSFLVCRNLQKQLL
ncbi:hypothetical protein D3C85_1772230 [compost metagenome]